MENKNNLPIIYGKAKTVKGLRQMLEKLPDNASLEFCGDPFIEVSAMRYKDSEKISYVMLDPTSC